MIPRFVIQPASIDLIDFDAPQKRLKTLELLRFWHSTAILFHGDCNLKDSPLLLRVERLPQQIRTLWQAGIKRALILGLARRGPSTWNGEFESASDAIREPIKGSIDLVLLSRDLFKHFTSSDEEYTHTFGDLLEVCRLDSVAHSNIARKLERDHSHIIDRGTAIERIWSEFFEPYVAHAVSTVVVDRFALRSHFDRRDGKSGLYRLLRGLSATGGKKSVRIYSSMPAEVTRAELEAEFCRLLNCWKRLKIEIVALPDEDFERIFHFRYIRFDLFCRVRVDSGLEVLQGEELYRPVEIAVEQVRMDLFRLEERCLNRCGGQPIVVSGSE